MRSGIVDGGPNGWDRDVRTRLRTGAVVKWILDHINNYTMLHYCIIHVPMPTKLRLCLRTNSVMKLLRPAELYLLLKTRDLQVGARAIPTRSEISCVKYAQSLSELFY